MIFSRAMKIAARLLLAIALLLPFRGAVAVAGILCHSSPEQPVAAAAQHGHHDHGTHDAFAPHDHVPPASGATGSQDPGTVASSCSFCTSACSSPLLPSATVTIHDPGAAGIGPPSVGQPGYASATVGPIERPPRTA